uniref:UV-stimulated scaffold protein A n=1 Tax=Leptobrachium leishanense TaxID=445787 RepID=A0A8C5M1Z2_9ANUR
MAEMDQRLAQLVECLTTSGEPQLNPEQMKELKKICRSSDDHISHMYHLLMTQLNQEHAEIRLSAFQIASELFTRSNHFRTLLISNFQEFLELTVETDYEQPLPPPKEVAQKLKALAIKTVQDWHEKFGEAYKKLSLGYHFLKRNKKVDFQDVRTRTLAEKKREDEKKQRLENIYKEKARKANEEMEEMMDEIHATLTEIESCFKLLLPDPDEFALPMEETGNGDKDVFALPVPAVPCADDDDDEQPCCSKDLAPVTLPNNHSENAAAANLCSKDLQSDESDGDYETRGQAFLRDHGLGSHKYTLSLEIPTDLKVSENENNTDVINNLKDSLKLAKNKYWPAVQSWIQIFTKAGVSDHSLLGAIDLKAKLECALKKQKDIELECKDKKSEAVSASDDDDDFEEVPEKEGYEPRIPDHLREEYGLEPEVPPSPGKKAPAKSLAPCFPLRRKRNNDPLKPTCVAATLKVMKDQLEKRTPSTSSGGGGEPSSRCETQEGELSKAPVVPIGLDLQYWGQEPQTAGKILKVATQHRFWASSEMDEEVESKELEAMLKTRYVSFPGKFEPVTHNCRHPLDNGSLCERQDRYKCPFHGKIIPRDEIGVAINPEDRAREEKQRMEKEAQEQDWRDPELMREIEQATGEDLGSSRYSGKGKRAKRKGKKKYPNLTDLKQKANTSRSRLEKKVFNTGSVKRVISAMNQMDQRRHEKFANQFNYALN